MILGHSRSNCILLCTGTFFCNLERPGGPGLLLLAAAGSVWVTLNLWLFSDLPVTMAIRQGVFCTVSGFTCCGLQNSSLDWLPLPLMIIMMLMVIGGAAGSTSGGVKVNRFILTTRGSDGGSNGFFVRGTVMVPFSHGGRNYRRTFPNWNCPGTCW